jgi:hypothetical protein
VGVLNVRRRVIGPHDLEVHVNTLSPRQVSLLRRVDAYSTGFEVLLYSLWVVALVLFVWSIVLTEEVRERIGGMIERSWYKYVAPRTSSYVNLEEENESIK